MRVTRGTAMEAFLKEADPDSPMGIVYQELQNDPALYFDSLTQASEELRVNLDRNS